MTEEQGASAESSGSTQSSEDQESQRTDSQPSQPDTRSEKDESGDESAEQGDQDTFPREYVEKLRKEAADHRAKAKDRDDLAKRLHTAQVAALGRLADPTDLPYSEELLDPEKLKEAVDELLARKPHLASRKPSGNVGQGEGTGDRGSVNLAELLRSMA